LGQEIQTAFLD